MESGNIAGDGDIFPPPEPESVIKSPMDPSEYKILTLSNGLKALLISTCRTGCPLKNSPINPDTGVFIEVEKFNEKYLKLASKKECPKEPENKRCKHENLNEDENDNTLKRGCGFAHLNISIGTGYFHDPQDFSGMAHLYEHCCLQYGSKKYAAHHMYRYFSKQKSFGAFTSGGFTNYNFTMDLEAKGKDGFKLGIDMLADAIFDPLLPCDAVYNEIHSVDSEFSLGELEEVIRIFAVGNLAWPEGHPRANFDCGTQETLDKPNLLERMIEWKQLHYVPNNTTLVIQAPLPLEELVQMIQECFGHFAKSSLPNPTDVLFQKFKNHVDKNFNKLYKMVPAYNTQMTMIRWELSEKYVLNLETKPLLYLQRYLNREGEGTIKEYLRNQHWALGMTAEYLSSIEGRRATFGSTFSIFIDLTDSGLKEFDQVLTAVYAFIRLIASEKPNKDLFTQIQMESADEFHYKEFERDDVNRYVELSGNLLFIRDPKYILTTRSLVIVFNPKLLQETVDLLTPENMNVFLVSKSFKGKCTKKEKLYQIEYSATKFSPGLIGKLKSAKLCDKFKPLKGLNPYRVENLICPLPRPQAKPMVQTLLENNKARVLYMRRNDCCIGNVPTGEYTILIGCPLMRETSKGSVLLCLWFSLLREKLAPVLELPNNASVETVIWQQGNFFQLYFRGAAQYLTKVAQLTLDNFMEFEKTVDEQTFTEHRTAYAKLINDFNTSTQYAAYMLDFLGTNKKLVREEIIRATNDITFEDLKKLVRIFKERMYLSALLVGCVSEANARAMSAYIDLMNYRELPETFPAKPAAQGLKLPLGERCLRIKNTFPLDHTSTVANYYQFGILQKEKELLLEKLQKAMSYPMFFQFHGTEHLSYANRLGLSDNAGVIGLNICVISQPHRHTTGYIDERIDSFLVNFRRDFACYDDIFTNPNFSEAYMTRQEHQLILKMYDEHLLPSGSKYRKLSVQIVGTPNPVKKGKPFQENLKAIQDKIAMFPPSSFSFDTPSKLSIEYDIPDGIPHENGYFVANLEAFRNSLSPVRPDTKKCEYRR